MMDALIDGAESATLDPNRKSQTAEVINIADVKRAP